jgi:hypothetical protein
MSVFLEALIVTQCLKCLTLYAVLHYTLVQLHLQLALKFILAMPNFGSENVGLKLEVQSDALKLKL